MDREQERALKSFVQTMIDKHQIPGMALGIAHHGSKHLTTLYASRMEEGTKKGICCSAVVGSASHAGNWIYSLDGS